jgi:hypothetical protein
MQELPQAQFNGWAKVEIMGHQSHVGYVKTEAYGMSVLFRVDTPALPEREYELTEPCSLDIGGGCSSWVRAGTKVKRAAVDGVTVLLGSPSIYRIIPCTEAAAMLAIEKSVRAPHTLVDVPRAGLLGAAGVDTEFEGDEESELDGKGFY